MNFDLSALDKLKEKGATTRNKKFAPTSRTRVRPSTTKASKAQKDSGVPIVAKGAAASAPAGPTGGNREADKEPKKQDAAQRSAQRPRPGALSRAQATNAPSTGLHQHSAPVPAHDGPGPSTQGLCAKLEQQQYLPSGAQPDRSHDSTAPLLLARTRRRQDQQQMPSNPSEGSAQGEGAPGSSGSELAIVPVQAEGSAAPQDAKQKKGRGMGKEKPVIDASTMSLKAIIKVAYAQERLRMEEERKRRKEEEAQMPAAEGSQARGGPATPKEAPARRAPSQGAPSLAPQVQVVNGRIVVVQNSLTVQAQAEDFQRRVTVEDNPKLNNASYSTRINNDRWTPQETELFYKAIKLFGTDFSLMEKMFPGRQRKALKFKLRREYKERPERVDAALSGKDCGASSYQEVVDALHKHTETQETNIIGGGPAEDPDLAIVLTGPVAEALEGADGAEAAKASAAEGAPQQLANPPEQAAQAGPAPGRKGKAATRKPARIPQSQPAQAEQQPAGAPRVTTGGRRKGRAAMATIPEEEHAAAEQPEVSQPAEDRAPRGTWGGRRRKKGPGKAEAPEAPPASAAAQAAEPESRPGAELDVPAAIADQHAVRQSTEQEQPSQAGPSACRGQPEEASQNAPANNSTTSNAAGPGGTGVPRSKVQEKRVLPRLAASRRKRQPPAAAASLEGTGGQGPSKRSKNAMQPPELHTAAGKPKSRVELLAEAAGACAAEWEEENVY